jgi:phosphomannomutase
MKAAYVFDVDGTLTPSRQLITDEFRDFFMQFALEHDVYLISGSDYVKTVEQLGEVIVNDLALRSYNCSGNSIWEKGVEIYANDWVLPDAGKNHLTDRLLGSKCPTKTSNHFEYRPGTVNFSTVGRDANTEQRAEYVKFDNETGERESIVESFNTYFGIRLNCVAHIGGETGIDITQVGHDKRQLLLPPHGYPQDIFENTHIHFFGDKTEAGGNDWPLAQAISSNDCGTVYQVAGWRDTMDQLQTLT